jgi:hypothetical protein
VSHQRAVPPPTVSYWLWRLWESVALTAQSVLLNEAGSNTSMVWFSPMAASI